MKRPEVEHNLLRLLKIDIIGCFIVASLLIAVVTLDLLGVGIFRNYLSLIFSY